MKKFFQYIALTAFTASLGWGNIAMADPGLTANPVPTPTATTVTPSPSSGIPTPPELSAQAYILMDASSGNILAANNPDEHRPPASLTKLMTLYVVANALKNGQIHLDDPVKISDKAWKMEGSRMFASVNTEVPLKDLIDGVIVASGNDATVALAEYTGGNEQTFVDMMNQTAQTLGMQNTHFTDSTGMPNPDHYTTSRDMAILARAWVNNFPEYYPWFKEKWITYNKIKQPNRNRLLWRDDTVDGIKTGHTDAAGFCLISSAQRNGTRLIAVLMGAPTDSARANESEALLNYGFRFFETHKLYSANTPITTSRVWLGENKTIPLGVAQDFYITIPTGQYTNLKPSIKSNNSLEAPIVKGQSCGVIAIMLNNQEISTQPLVALQDDPAGGMFKRTYDHTAHLFNRWFGSS